MATQNSSSTIYKSNPLISLSQSELSLTELKILDFYLSRINRHDPGNRTIVCDKSEIEEALGVTKINIADLSAHLASLVQPVSIIEKDNNSTKIRLFEKAAAEKDEYGVWQVFLICSENAKKYIFSVEDYGYVRYRLSKIASLTCRYSYALFCYIERNRFRRSWEIQLDDLKKLLRCNNQDTYAEYQRFNEKILKKCQRELSEKSNCRYTYIPIRHGRSVTSIRFEIVSSVPENNIT